MRWILDTDTCIYLLREQLPELADRMRNIDPVDLGVTSITVAELAYGALHSSRPDSNLARVNQFLAPLSVLDFDTASALQFARIKQHLVTNGQQIGLMDMLIASIAITDRATLVTNNQREFNRVPELRTENWIPSAR